MGFPNIGSSKGCQFGARHLRNVHAPRRRRASIKTYQVALIRALHQPVKGQVIICARSLRKSPSKVNWEQWAQSSPPTLAQTKRRTLWFGGGEKYWKKVLYYSKTTRTTSQKMSYLWAIAFYTTSRAVFQGRRLSLIRRTYNFSRHTILPWFL